MYKLNSEDNTPNPTKQWNSGDKTFTCWFYLPPVVPLPPKPLLHGSQCKGLADINHFLLHPQHPSFREYLLRIANNISGIPKCLQISIRQSNCCIEISITREPRLKIQSNLYERPPPQHSWQHSVILGKMMEKVNKFARGHQLKR